MNKDQAIKIVAIFALLAIILIAELHYGTIQGLFMAASLTALYISIKIAYEFIISLPPKGRIVAALSAVSVLMFFIAAADMRQGKQIFWIEWIIAFALLFIAFNLEHKLKQNAAI